MGKVHRILRAKGNKILSISPDISVYNALEIMVENNVSSLVVVEDENLVGIFTERDYARKVILKGKASKDTTIGEIMSVNVITVTPDSTIDECMQIMTGKFIRHIPVLENGKMVGIVSIGDLVKYIIEEQKFIIENMEHYIVGDRF
jgi:CBS domain-containing protein